MEPAPLFKDISGGPGGGRAFWLTCEDGVRVRAAAWASGKQKGTVILFPGRTEYIEKYGHVAQDFAKRGFATMVIDWRGQGLADRLIANKMTGHVHKFSDYQMDVDAAFQAAEALSLPRPWHVLGHSMGGAIGLRAAMRGLPIVSCAFSGPMWGVELSLTMRPVAWTLSWISRYVGLGHYMTPTTSPQSYVFKEPFVTNKLSSDSDMYLYMINQVRAHPELGLGGPSLRWLYEALNECRVLSKMPSPNLPCYTFVGSEEDIVDSTRIHQRMASWPGGTLDIIQDGMHEIMMDTPDMRRDIFDRMCRFFEQENARKA